MHSVFENKRPISKVVYAEKEFTWFCWFLKNERVAMLDARENAGIKIYKSKSVQNVQKCKYKYAKSENYSKSVILAL